MTVAEGSRLAENAFRTLGLSVAATDREIRRRAQELRLRLELDGNDPAAVARIRAAESALEDPVGRLREELYWIHLTPDPIPPDIEFADAAAVREAVAQLEPLANAGSDAAVHDLAVLRHGAVLAADRPPVGAWARALTDWRQVWQHEPFWFRMNLRAEQLGDPRANGNAVGALRADLPARVLESLAADAARLLRRGADADAAARVRVILNSGFPPEALEAARGRALADAVSVARDAIRSARERLGSVVRENANRTAFHRALALNQLAVDAEQQVVPLVERLKRVDSDNPDVRLVADDAAELFQSLSLRLNNDADDVTGAVVPLEQAERLAVSESAKQRIAENLRVVRGNMAARSARGLVGAIDLARALDAEAAVAAASAPPRERKRGFPWGWVWAAVVGLAVLSRLGPGGGSSGTAVTPTVRVDPNAAVRQQLTALQAEIDSARSDIANRESRINATEADIDSMKARLDSIESRYRATGAPPEVVREYDALRARFNAAVSEYNQELAAYKAKLADANRKVNEYNSLLRTAR